MKLITISGVDGSGKSTQTQLLKKYLESKGYKVFYFHIIQDGAANKIKNFIARHCMICKLSKSCKLQSPKIDKGVTKANSVQILARKIFLFIDAVYFRYLSKKLEKDGYDYILSDRYFFDSIVNVQYLSKKYFSFSNFTKPNYSFFISIEPSQIMQRERAPEQGEQYLIDKNEIFSEHIASWNMSTVNGSKPKETIFEEIKKYLEI